MTDNYLLVPVAIRADERFQLRFPANITTEEAEKVARVIRAYAVEPTEPGTTVRTILTQQESRDER